MYGPSDEIETITTPSQDKITAQSNVASSNIKKILDTWYVNNIINKGLERAIKDAIFCNDRTIPGKSLTNSEDTELGYGKNWTGYGAYARHYKNNSTDTTLKCEQKNDRFTVSNDKGNGSLTYPVGTISVDEAVVAGSGSYGTANYLYYLYKGLNYWTMTPMNFHGGTRYSYVLIINSNGGFVAGSQVVTQSYGVSPVINLNAQYVNELIGTGTMTDPYRASNDTP